MLQLQNKGIYFVLLGMKSNKFNYLFELQIGVEITE